MMLSLLRTFLQVCLPYRYRILGVLVCVCISSQVASAQTDARNRKPRIEGQRELSVIEEESIEITLDDLEVEDKDDWFYPWGFTLDVYEGENYSLSGHTVIPNEDFDGELQVRVTVNDGEDDSEPFDLIIAVIGVNDPPLIAGQNDITVNEDEAFILDLSHLLIDDPDDEEFEMAFSAGENYTIENNQIVPAPEFSGTLIIPVSISDGEFLSGLFNVTVTVQAVNDPPTIIAQQELSTVGATALTITLEHLTVNDPDNTYPQGFTLRVIEGPNYSVSGNAITPAEDYEGNLPVTVVVNDGSADSEPFELSIIVQKGNRPPVIVGQQPVIIDEDQSFILTFNHLQVNDPDNSYPTGYSIRISNGNNYTVSGLTITPSRDFSGNIFADVTVDDGEKSSEPFSFQITVSPVNDPPAITIASNDSLILTRGKAMETILKELTITDVDNDSVSLAEIGFAERYEPGYDFLHFTNTTTIKGFFDLKNGVLALIGKDSKNQYKKAIEAVKAEILERENADGTTRKQIYLTVNDGQHGSNRVTQDIYIKSEETVIDLQIPSGFTPNGDHVNDTWGVQPLTDVESFQGATIRVYTKSGILVFEANGLSKEWDGRYNGALLPPDVYYYTIDLNIPEATNALKGIVTILR